MNQLTPQATNLYNALMKRGIKCEIEMFDGHKRVDISIPWAQIDIEVDGLHHYTNPDQIARDFKRSYWSLTRDDYDTFHVPNIIIEEHLDAVADALAEVARLNYSVLKEQKIHWLSRLLSKIF